VGRRELRSLVPPYGFRNRAAATVFSHRREPVESPAQKARQPYRGDTGNCEPMSPLHG